MSIRLECTKTELQLAPTHNEYRNLMSCYIVVPIHIQNLPKNKYCRYAVAFIFFWGGEVPNKLKKMAENGAVTFSNE